MQHVSRMAWVLNVICWLGFFVMMLICSAQADREGVTNNVLGHLVIWCTLLILSQRLVLR
jgi:hypothetical protein